MNISQLQVKEAKTGWQKLFKTAKCILFYKQI